jgi:hypothetical protein
MYPVHMVGIDPDLMMPEHNPDYNQCMMMHQVDLDMYQVSMVSILCFHYVLYMLQLHIVFMLSVQWWLHIVQWYNRYMPIVHLRVVLYQHCMPDIW